jgi:hypothetical protein
VQLQVCAVCSNQSPEADTNFTIIGKGWRVRRYHEPNGDRVVQWLCPSCWRSLKEGPRKAPPPQAASDTPSAAFARAGHWLRRGARSDPPPGR